MSSALYWRPPAGRIRSIALGGLSLAAALLVDVPGFAEISAPAQNESVSGIVSISGTANHPAFISYELAFSHDPDPTDTWFPIAESIRTPVLDGRLGIWDTTGISDGSYRIRLQVMLQDSEPLVAIEDQVRVRNYTPTETPSGPPTAQPTASPTPPPLAEPVFAPPSQAKPDRNPFISSLAIGVIGAFSIMLALYVYLQLSPRIRAYAAYLRMRKLHRRQDLGQLKRTKRD
jgi:hypothetical protein